MREQLNTVGHNMNGKHLSIPKRLQDSGAWRWDSKQFLLRSVLLLLYKLIYKCGVHFMYVIILYYTVLCIICNSICSICSNMVTINIMWLERKWAKNPITIGAARKQKARQNTMAVPGRLILPLLKKKKNWDKKDKWVHHVGSEPSFLGIIQSWVAWKPSCHLSWCRIILSVW